MIYRLSIWLTNWFIRQGRLRPDDYAVYVYCIDSLLNKVFFYTVILTVASVLRIMPITICYYLGFIPFRYTAGGFHAKSEMTCTLLSWLMYGVSMALASHLDWVQADAITHWIPLMLVGLATLIAYLYAPVEHVNKPVAQQQKQRLRKLCLCLQGGFLGVTMLLSWQHYYNYAFSLALGNTIAALFLALAYYQTKSANQKGGMENEKNVEQVL